MTIPYLCILFLYLQIIIPFFLPVHLFSLFHKARKKLWTWLFKK